MATWYDAYGGSIGSQFRLYITASVTKSEEDNNRSYVTFNAYMQRVSGSSRAWNLYSQTAHANFNGDNNTYHITYDFNIGVGSRVYIVKNWSKWVGHNSNGTGSAHFASDHDAGNSPYITTASVGGTLTLPTLYQEIGISSVGFSNITDVSFAVRVKTNRPMNRLELSINGGAYSTYWSGSSDSDVTVQVGSATNQLLNNKSYTVKARVRRASNNNLTESGTYTVTTEGGGIFDIGDF